MTALRPTYQYPSVSVGEDLHPAAEHGAQHVIVLGQRGDGGVVQRPAHVQLHVLAGVGARPRSRTVSWDRLLVASSRASAITRSEMD